MGAVTGEAPHGVAQKDHPDGHKYYYWLRSWRGDWGWDVDTLYLLRIEPPDTPYHVDFMDIPKRAKAIKVGMAVGCPTCGAAAGVQCKRPSEHQSPFKDMHSARKDRADAVFFWQYGAGASVVPDLHGRPNVKLGMDRLGELIEWSKHREVGVTVAKARGVRLPPVPKVEDVDLGEVNAPAPIGEAMHNGQMAMW